ncbi:MAG TPA: hypothetical protein VF746_06645 [Longimicrobium sp.]|jgi:hypothetical protein
MSAVPFTLRRQELTSAALKWEQVDTVVRGLLRLDDDDLVFQWREEASVQRWGGGGGYSREKSESEVMEKRVPLAALRSARLKRRWWLLADLALAAADLRAFEGLPGGRGSELVVRVARADRSAAADLASGIELALADRLLAAPARGALARG